MHTTNDFGMEGRKLHANISSFAAESMSHNVHDLLVEFLLRLPSKSLLRFKSVCKSWRALISSRYFCLLWQQHHQGPGILLMSAMICRPHRYVPLSGPTTGIPQFELPSDVHHMVLQSYKGFLLHMKYENYPRNHKYWVYNPATLEVVVLPPPRMDTCKIHPRRCRCIIRDPVLAFDSHSHGRVVGLASRLSRRRRAYIYQVCVTENQGAWRSSSKTITLKPLSSGVNWRNFVVWLNPVKTLFYDVWEEGLRFCDSPRFLTSQFFYGIVGPYSYHLGESAGHLHFIHIEESRLIINEMKHDLSGWFVKHKIELSQIEASLVRSIGWDIDTDVKFKINILMKEKEYSMLVLGCLNDVVLYRIQDQKSWKLFEWEFVKEGGRLYPCSIFTSSCISMLRIYLGSMISIKTAFLVLFLFLQR